MKSLIKLYWEKKGYNIVILVPNIRKAQIWEKEGALIVDKENISDAVNKLKNGNNNFMVLINRYDGIDLWGNMCHLLILDGLPKGKSIRDIAVAHMRSESPLTKATTAQTIEQGLGRSVRSGSDYCVTLLLDDNLLNFISNNNNRKYFSETTRAQLDLGISLSMDFQRKKET
ncbi:helicase C-terminal domain-containing protein [Holzapfeliella floricola]|uniref:helicase C-terminal domain-containing protein n=1 Tax=Holzapfeliella floricola TaxID=679249 RepID=UPI000B1462C1|nr:helicase C-terminal domain-containing protein [Holzapfeliella floricola]